MIRVAFAKDTIKNGPRIDSNRGVITATQEQELYRYYGLVADTAGEGNLRRHKPGRCPAGSRSDGAGTSDGRCPGTRWTDRWQQGHGPRGKCPSRRLTRMVGRTGMPARLLPPHLPPHASPEPPPPHGGPPHPPPHLRKHVPPRPEPVPPEGPTHPPHRPSGTPHPGPGPNQ